jgi:hypothetical protein
MSNGYLGVRSIRQYGFDGGGTADLEKAQYEISTICIIDWPKSSTNLLKDAIIAYYSAFGR